jgi:membrane fusion protein (multidrug efflux system)
MRQALGATLMIALLWLAGGCSQSNPVAAGSPASAPQPAPRAPEETLSISGPLVVENQVDVTARREGVVVKTLAEPGTRVRTGQLLGTLDDRQIAADLEAQTATVHRIEFNLKNWEADLQMLRVDLERSQKMWDAQLITKEQLDHDKYKVAADEFQVDRERQALRSAQASQRSLELELEKTRIIAPFDGIVARRYVRAGQRVAMGDRLFWVTAEAPLRVKFTLPERFYGRLRKGEELGLSSPDVPGERRKAKIIALSPVIDPSSGTIEVMAEVTGPPGQFRPGMTANIELADSR